MKRIRVVAGIICYQGRILLARRSVGKSQGGLWEFPGGKIEAGESPQESLCRELQEELGLVVEVGPLLAVNAHDYSHVRIQLEGYWAKAADKTVKLTVHDAVDWVLPEEIAGYPLAPADIPIARHILGHPYLSLSSGAC